MPERELSDDYVANLLKDDAKNCALRYAHQGLGALLPKRSTTHARKPNVRFLRNVIRESNNHNAALLAKETDEAKAKLNLLTRDELALRNEKRPQSDIRQHKRNQGDEIEARKRKRSSDNHHRDHSGQSGRSHRDETRYQKKRSHGDSSSRTNTHRSSHHIVRESCSQQEYGSTRKSRHRPSSKDAAEMREKLPRQSRTAQSSLKAHASHKCSGIKERHQHPRASFSESLISSPSHEFHKSREFSPAVSGPSIKNTVIDDDSDPLEDIVGPLPPLSPVLIRRKGRGAFTSSSSTAMDLHIVNDSDSTMHVKPDFDKDDDWDESLEAMRDRARWRKQGADRLRQAGFTDAQIRKWETGDDKNEEDVRWAKNGEGREWDRGKVMDLTGNITLQAAWAS